MNSLRDHLRKAQETGKAIGHFNISDLVFLKAVFAAAHIVPLFRLWAHVGPYSRASAKLAQWSERSLASKN
jgi:hypothetical protein